MGRGLVGSGSTSQERSHSGMHDAQLSRDRERERGKGGFFIQKERDVMSYLSPRAINKVMAAKVINELSWLFCQVTRI